MSTRNTSQKNVPKNQNQGPNDDPPHKYRSTPKGYRGLVNQGSTCYLNAVLQTLFMTPEFRKAIMLKDKNEENRTSFSCHLQQLFRSLESKNTVAFTNEVSKALGIGNVSQQQDAVEYYQKILSMIETEAANIFQGLEKHSTTCPKNHEYTEGKCFFALAISMDSSLVLNQQVGSINVQKSFDAQFEEMRMTGEDRLFCERCKTRTDMTVMCTLIELPSVLTLHLKRFYLNYRNMTYMKNNRTAEIPFQLKVQDDSGLQHEYELYAVVNHVGSLSGGHYYADIKSFEDQQWYRFDDSMVQMIEIDNKRPLKYFVSDAAYLLFFRKCKPEIPQYYHKDSCSTPLQNTVGPAADSTADPCLKDTSEGHMRSTNLNTDTIMAQQNLKCESPADKRDKPGSPPNYPKDSDSTPLQNSVGPAADSKADPCPKDTSDGHGTSTDPNADTTMAQQNPKCHSPADNPESPQYHHKDSCSTPLQNTTGPAADSTADPHLKDTPKGRTRSTNLNTDTVMAQQNLKSDSPADKRVSGFTESTFLKDGPQQHKSIKRANTWSSGDPPCDPQSGTAAIKAGPSVPGTADPALLKPMEVQLCVNEAGAGPSVSSTPVSAQDVSSSPPDEPSPLLDAGITHSAAPEDDIKSLQIKMLESKIELAEIKMVYYKQKIKKLSGCPSACL